MEPPPERLAPDLTGAIVQALCPAAHERAQHHRGVLIQGRAEHRGSRQDDGPRDHPLVEDLTHLAHPVVDVDFGAPQAPGRLTAQRHQGFALATGHAAVCDIASLFWIATRQHLGYPALVIRWLVTRMGMLQRPPVIGNDRFEDPPVPGGLWRHRVAPSRGDDMFAVQRCYHASSVSSIPHELVPWQPSPVSSSLSYGDCCNRETAFSYTMNKHQRSTELNPVYYSRAVSRSSVNLRCR